MSLSHFRLHPCLRFSLRFTAPSVAPRSLHAAALPFKIAGHVGAVTLALACLSHGAGAAEAAKAAKPAPTPTPASATAEAPAGKATEPSSNLDGALFYQILVAEIQANAGEAGSAYQIYLEAARRHQIGQLYQRAVEIALRGRAGEQALAAAKAWRQALPQSREANEYMAQILMALGRSVELAPPLRALIQLTPAPQQPQVIAGLPRNLARVADKQSAAQVIDDATQPWRQPPLELAEAWTASAEGWLQAKDATKSLASLNKALAIKPAYPGAGLVALDLMALQPDAEALVKQQLALPDAPTLVRLAYGRKLAGAQRYEESAEQLEKLLATQPDQLGSWLTLAAVRLELKQLDKAEAALKPVLDSANTASQAKGNASDTTIAGVTNDLEQAYLLMSQIAEQRKQWAQAVAWIERADVKHEKLAVQGQHARLLYRQGKLSEARALIRSLPETEPRDAVAKYQAEAQLLRDAQQWEEAYKVLGEASKRFPEDADLMYDQAMLGEKLQKFADMEKLLRTVITLTPENPNAFNALGYSLADRGVRLPEARELVQKALEMRPGDPFITDSMGWVEFRAGRIDEAVRLLQEAYQLRADPEIAAHLGEVLWAQNKQDEAREVWRKALKADADNDTLKATMKRFKVSP